MLVATDLKGKGKFARIVGSKGLGEGGNNEWVIRELVKELEEWGYNGQDMILRTDGEPSIVAVAKAVAVFRVGRTVPEVSARGESSSNGAVEEAGKAVREFVRVLKDQVEHKVGMEFGGKNRC